MAEVVESSGPARSGVRGRAVVNILEASRGEVSMMARCTGKTKLHNLEPEDLRANPRHRRGDGHPAGGQALGSQLHLVQGLWNPAITADA